MSDGLFSMIHNDPAIVSLGTSQAMLDYLSDLEGKISKGGIDEFLNEIEALSSYGWEREPVSAHEFFTSGEYLCDRHVARIHPVSLQHLIDMCDLQHSRSIIIDTGALGTGKSFRQAHWGLWLIYLVSCLRDPSEYLGLGSGTELVIGVTATKLKTSDELAYSYIMDMLDNSPWFNRNYHRDRNIDTMIELPKKLKVIPESPTGSPFIGKNLLAWLGDEVSFLEDTKTTRQERNMAESGADSQSKAKRLFNKMNDRILSRFVGRKNFFGGIYICSSRQYPTDFMENLVNRYKKRELSPEEMEKYYVVEHAAWDLKDNIDKTNTFTVVIGSSQTGSYVLGEGERVPIDVETVKVPMAYRTAFENDIEEALRNQAGISTVTVMPLIPKVSVIQRAYEIGEQFRIPLRHPCFKHSTTLMEKEGELFDVEYLCYRGADGKLIPRRDPDRPRFIHIDLSKGVGDPAGLAMLYMPHIVSQSLGGLDFINDRPDLPFVTVELMLHIIPPKGGMMRYDRIRQIPIFLRDRLGFDVKWVTSDMYQSAGILQGLQLLGFNTDDTVSLDRSPDPYLQLRAAFNEGRIAVYPHPTFNREIRKLRWDLKYRKIDHPMFDEESPTGKGSKDMSDCVAGAMFKLTKLFLDGEGQDNVFCPIVEQVPIVHEKVEQDLLMRRVFDDNKKPSNKDYEHLIDLVLASRMPFI